MVFASKQWIFLNRLTPFLQKRAKSLLLGVVCIVFTAMFVLASPYVVGKAVDSLHEAIIQAKLILYTAVIIGLTIPHRGLYYKLYQLQYKDQEVDV